MLSKPKTTKETKKDKSKSPKKSKKSKSKKKQTESSKEPKNSSNHSSKSPIKKKSRTHIKNDSENKSPQGKSPRGRDKEKRQTEKYPSPTVPTGYGQGEGRQSKDSQDSSQKNSQDSSPPLNDGKMKSGESSKKNSLVSPPPNISRHSSFQNPDPLPVEKPSSDSQTSNESNQQRWNRPSSTAIPGHTSGKPSLVPYIPPENETGQDRRGSKRLQQLDKEPPRSPHHLSILTEPPSANAPPKSEERQKYASIVGAPPNQSTSVPTALRRLSEKKKEDMMIPVPSVSTIIEESRRRSSVDRTSVDKIADTANQESRKSSRQPKDGVYEVTIYSNKGASFDTAFKQQKAHLITPHTLYKEALYTSVHYLGVPTVRFPSNKEDLCIYSHIVFKAEPQEQVQAMEHVVGEPFPLTVVNTKVRRADGIEARDHQNVPDSYCIVAVESTESGVEFQLSIKEWQSISIGSPLRPKNLKSPYDHTRPPPEKRFDQTYDTVPPFIKTAVQLQTRAPSWEQRFQCLALRPSIDTLTIELWDNEVDPPIVEQTPNGRKWSNSSKSKIIKKRDMFIGKVSIPVKDVPCEGESKWHYIRGTTHRKKEASGRLLVEIWLTHAYRHGRNYEEYAEPRQMLEMFWDHILEYESSRFNGTWNGEIPPAATCLIFQYALQTGISEASQAIVRWNAYAKYNLGLFSLERRLFELEYALEKAREWKDTGGCEEETNMMMGAIDKILPIIRNHLNESQETVHEAVKSIKHCRDILTKCQCQSGLLKVQFCIEAEIRMAILEWYEKKFKEFAASLSVNPQVHDRIECLARLINDVNALMRECLSKWKPLFWMDGLIDYMPLAYDEFQKMIIHDVEPLCFYSLKPYDTNKKLRATLLNINHSEARHLCKALFDLYVQTQVFFRDQEKMFENTNSSHELSIENYKYLNHYDRWFRPVLVLWLGYALIKAADMISRSIKIDNVIAQDEFVMTSSSATDAGVVYHQLATFWQQLKWPDIAEGYVILHYLFEVMCFITVMYAKLKRAKLEKEGYFDTVDRFDISERFCTALNNIEYVKESLIKIPDDIKMDTILADLDNAVGDSYAQTHRMRINNLLTGTLGHIETQFKRIMVGVSERVRPELREGFHECFLFLQDSTKTEDDALVPVLSYLEDNIVILHKSLMELNFIRVLQMFWNVTCQEILYGLKLFTKAEDARTHAQFFQKVQNMVPLLRNYFQGGGGGLNDEEIDTKYYRALNLFLSCLSLPTDVLIAAYYREAAEEQMEKLEESKLGTLTVRVNYHSGALAVEVISAKNLSARDEPLPFLQCCLKQEPSSDPQVEVCLEPPLHFKDVKRRKTEIKWKTLDPVFNEKFSWQVAEATCSRPESVIVFIVKDYDRLSHDDFLGYAVVPIAKMPGLAKMRPIGQPMTLTLQSVNTKHNPVLTILQNRPWDSQARQFAQEQAKRVITIKGGDKDDQPVVGNHYH